MSASLSKPLESPTNWPSSAMPHLCHALSSTSCRLRRLSLLRSPSSCWDGVWETSWLPLSDVPACPPPTVSPPPASDARRPPSTSEGAQKKKKNPTVKQPVSYTQGQEHRTNFTQRVESLGKGKKTGGGGSPFFFFFPDKILSWMSIHFKDSYKKTPGYISQRLHTKGSGNFIHLPSKEQETPWQLSAWGRGH